MGMNPVYYFETFVLPNYRDFSEEEGNLRKGFNAVLSISHMPDNYFHYYRVNEPGRVSQFKELKDFRVHLATIASYFNDIQSIANAFKHLYTPSDKAHVTIESGGVIMSAQFQDNGTVEIIGCETNDRGKEIVIYKRKDGAILRLKEALSQVIDMWQKILDEPL